MEVRDIPCALYDAPPKATRVDSGPSQKNRKQRRAERARRRKARR